MVLTPDLHYHDSLPSTMDAARALAASGAAEGTVVQAGTQTAGRGRFGNDWVSPAGNLYMTLVLRPDVSARFCAQLSFVSAIALADALARAGVPSAALGLKWPNDVLVAGEKIAGILLEMETAGPGRPDFVLVGIGVNVAQAPPGRAVLRRYAPDATAAGMRDLLLEVFAAWYARWLEDGFDVIRARWLEQAVGIGSPVVARMAGRSLEGIFAGIDAEGNLCLDQADGACVVVHGGDVHFKPPEKLIG